MCNATITNMDTQVTSDSKVEVNPVMESNLNQNGEPGVMASTPDQVEPQLPVKKPTRQWAAWTHQEEESFFAALRQVGKNFEKITRRVQSKNKDQVRHYYYRLVRRMNKLLGPGLFLDAKNSKDTNAAMLRWWSLLEKYSCKASKLHLKPRRFKLFIEALENQLLKDRKKNVRRRPLQEENGSPTALGAITHQNRSGGHDTRTVKPVVEGSQNIQRVGAGRGSLKRNVNIGIIRSNHKGESTTMKPVRQRRKQGVLSSAAYKRWEKAAMAGVSLVADAAAHLERTVTDKEVEHNHHIGGENGHIPVDNVLPLRPLPFPSYMNSHPVEGILNPNTKLKLQLFPIDDGTRRALEMDKRNPYLELTLSTRKKISSVLEHLNRKWGDSCVASGELILFPYNVQRENILGYQRWTQDSTVNAADVYILIGSPPVFRLRYGWFSNNELASLTCREPPESNHVPYQDSRGMACKEGKTMDLAKISVHPTNDNIGLPDDICMNQLSAENRGQSTAPQTDDYIDTTPGSILVKLSTSASNVPWHRKETCDEADMTDLEDPNDMRLGNGTTLSAGEWADSLTNISVGDLLSEVSNDENDNFIEPLTGLKDQCFQQIPFSCDSFDAAIAAHFAKHENKMAYESAVSSHSSSIFDAEETCDAFAFAKNHNLCNEVCAPSIASPRTSSPRARTGSMTSSAYEEVPVVEEQADCPASDPIGACSPNQQVENVSPKDFNGLPDISWPDSLGPLDLDIPSFKYHSEDLILSNSLGGLNRLIASSLDAFQNCSFFGLDKKD